MENICWSIVLNVWNYLWYWTYFALHSLFCIHRQINTSSIRLKIHALIKNIFICLNQQLLPVVKFAFKIGYSTETLYDNSNEIFSFGKYLSIIWRCRSRNASNSISLSDMFGFQLMLHHYHYLWSDLTGNLLIVMASLVASSQFME